MYARPGDQTAAPLHPGSVCGGSHPVGSLRDSQVEQSVGGKIADFKIDRLLAIRRAIAAVTALLLMVSCASTPILGQSWMEVRTPNLVLISDADPAFARQLAGELDWFHHFVAFTMRQSIAREALPARFVVFADDDSFRRFTGAKERIAGFFRPGLIRPTIFVDGSLQPAFAYEVACHEYVHLWLRSIPDRRFPIWYEEGLAMLLSQLRLEGDEIVLGGSSRLGVLPFASPFSVDLRSLLTQGPGSETYHDLESGRSFHSSAWALTQYLVMDETRRQRLETYLELWSDGMPAEEAFRIAFGREVVEAERERTAAFRKGLPLWRVPVSSLRFDKGRVESRLLAPSEAARALGTIAADGDGRLGPFAEPLLQAAAEAAPGDPQIAVWLGLALASGDAEARASATAWIEAAVAAEPEQAEVQALAGEALLTVAIASARSRTDLDRELLGRAETHFAKSARLLPRLAIAQRGLGVLRLLSEAEPEAAIGVLEEGRTRRPSDPILTWALAAAWARAGNAERAAALREQARYLGLDDADVARLDALLRSPSAPR